MIAKMNLHEACIGTLGTYLGVGNRSSMFLRRDKISLSSGGFVSIKERDGGESLFVHDFLPHIPQVEAQ